MSPIEIGRCDLAAMQKVYGFRKQRRGFVRAASSNETRALKCGDAPRIVID
jgi:hypothetical protein